MSDTDATLMTWSTVVRGGCSDTNSGISVTAPADSRVAGKCRD